MAFFIHSGKGDARKEENASYIKQRREKMNGIMVLVAYAVLMIVATIVSQRGIRIRTAFMLETVIWEQSALR